MSLVATCEAAEIIQRQVRIAVAQHRQACKVSIDERTPGGGSRSVQLCADRKYLNWIQSRYGSDVVNMGCLYITPIIVEGGQKGKMMMGC
jgi:hypothetical protein